MYSLRVYAGSWGLCNMRGEEAPGLLGGAEVSFVAGEYLLLDMIILSTHSETIGIINGSCAMYNFMFIDRDYTAIAQCYGQ